jgi:hypothetical protein
MVVGKWGLLLHLLLLLVLVLVLVLVVLVLVLVVPCNLLVVGMEMLWTLVYLTY